MSYVVEDIARQLKAARLRKNLSQRDLAEKVGVPQSHISRIENGNVDIRVSSLIEFARVLDLELSLVPRKLVPTVQSIIRSSETEQFTKAESMQKAVQQLNRIHKLSDELSHKYKNINELARVSRLAEQLKTIPAVTQQFEQLDKINKQLKQFQKGIGDISYIQNAFKELQSMRNSLVYATDDASHRIEEPQPAYRLDEDEGQDNG
ncbi:helix-turn-helix transcriptional regulator [Thiohalophilus sp.]|uniref:helix-turn-helix domain-containing protein n=1 Tax=Thiohalophilus sp. TaxID=3028392 RepID=UPI002ACE1613|nr:helix-turn-helix transcriptional regulator [Thiohalophilus sp.]MDZ7661644.1 helix-turn-helix transcriptional regulator [Thiohalophilus sp.]MDZ7803615.1 helix-turn-helix transcriptional regulator [Thiohalophilus sp.]